MRVGFREVLEHIMADFAAARAQPFNGQHPIAQLVTRDAPESVRQLVTLPPDFIVKGSVGVGLWVEGPWVAIFDPLVTETAQEGYYPVYLFSSSLDAVYLSFNQGVTNLKKESGTEAARRMLKTRAQILRSRLKGDFETRFLLRTIDLHPTKKGSLLELYECGHAFGCRYEKGIVPGDEELAADLAALVELYQLATRLGGTDELDADESDGVTDAEAQSLEEKRRYRLHRRLERNGRLAREAKRIHGTRCQVCNFDYEAAYGDLGRGYIEAHHKVPLAKLPENATSRRSPRDDFAVLCASCHRMIHRRDAPATFEEFSARFRGS